MTEQSTSTKEIRDNRDNIIAREKDGKWVADCAICGTKNINPTQITFCSPLSFANCAKCAKMMKSKNPSPEEVRLGLKAFVLTSSLGCYVCSKANIGVNSAYVPTKVEGMPIFRYEICSEVCKVKVQAMDKLKEARADVRLYDAYIDKETFEKKHTKLIVWGNSDKLLCDCSICGKRDVEVTSLIYAKPAARVICKTCTPDKIVILDPDYDHMHKDPNCYLCDKPRSAQHMHKSLSIMLSGVLICTEFCSEECKTKFMSLPKGSLIELPSVCEYCKMIQNTFSCSACKAVKYCSKECQKAAWKSHKADCKKA